MVTRRTATGEPTVIDGAVRATDSPGLGVEPLPEVLGEPVAVYE